MSRIGNAPITVPSGVDVTTSGRQIAVKGPKGSLERQIPGDIDATLAGAAIIGAVRTVMISAMRMEPRPAPEKVADQLWSLIEGAVGLRP